MSVTSGFFNSLNGDRKYDARQVSEFFDGLITDGVIQTIGDHFTVSESDTNNQVYVGTGRAWFDHHWLKNDNVFVVNLEQSDLMYPRYDAVVIEVNDDVDVRQCSIKAVKGTASSSPVYPNLTNTNTVHQYPLAYISRKVANDIITTADITQMVGKNACPYVVGVQKGVSIEYLVEQWESEWADWFAKSSAELQEQTDVAVELSKNAIDGTTAGNLQNQITDNRTDIDNKVDRDGDTMTGELNLEVPLAIESGGTGGSTVNEARTNLGVPGYVFKNNYWGLANPNGNDESWTRTPLSGIIPYEIGGSGSVGSSSWPFNAGYFKNLYVNGTAYTKQLTLANVTWVSSGAVSLAAGGTTTVTKTVTYPSNSGGAIVLISSLDGGTGYCTTTFSGNTATITFHLRNISASTRNVSMAIHALYQPYTLTA